MTERNIPRQQSLIEPLVHNPFVHRLNLSIWDKIQLAVMTVTIFPIRLLLLCVCLLLSWGCAQITMMGRSKESCQEPMSGWRHFVRPVTVFWSRAVFFWCGFHWVTIKGQRASAAEAPVLATASHSTFYDAVANVALDLTSVVAKSEAENVPLFGTLIRFTQPVFVSREDPDSRQNTIQEIKRRAQSGGKWPQIFIFPEGTCTNRTCLISFKPGAFYPGVPVQPVCLRYTNKMDTVTWTWDGPTAWQVIWLTMCQFHNYLEVEFMPVYHPSEEEKNNPRLFAENVRAKMAECLGVPVTDHTYEDCRLMMYAAKLNFPAASGLIEFTKVGKKLGLNYDNATELLEKFCGIAQRHKGGITVEELGRHLELPVSDALRELFALYDRSGSGTIDFREYVIGLHLVAHPANTEETIKLAFQLFDSGAKGYITQDELVEILDQAFAMETEDSETLFALVDQDRDDKITYEEFQRFAQGHPEYAKLLCTYQDLKSKDTDDRFDLRSLRESPSDTSINSLSTDSNNGKVKAE